MKALQSCIVACVLSAAAIAQTYVYDQPMAPNGGVLRASQLWIDPTGQNDLDSDALAWEDFQLPQDTYVTRVRWWGAAAPSLGFMISFFHQDPGTIAVQPDIFGPGSGPIREEFMTNFSETALGGGLSRFEVDLATPLFLVANTRYFISIVGQTPIPYANWNWAASSSGPNGTFWWLRGAHMYFHLPESRAMSLGTTSGAGVGVAFCFGDGLSGPCPCGNTSASGAGCANSTGAGAVLSAMGSASIAADDLVLSTTGMPASKSCIAFYSSNLAAPSVFFDGRRCLYTPIQRLLLSTSDATGAVLYGPGLANSAGFLAGNDVGFQVWYRDSTGPCGFTTNLSNALLVPFVP